LQNQRREQRCSSINVIVRISALTTSVNETAPGNQVATVGPRTRSRCGSLAVAVLVVLGLGLGAACGPIVERAPFSYRPDTMSPGDLLGPFEGIVVDADTDHPLAGAVVAASWAFERGIGLVGPAGSEEILTETGADGRYRLPALSKLPSGLSMRVRRFTLIVYQRGYVGWRSDRRFPDGRLRRDFSQRGNRVRLEKWRDTYYHHKHLLFLGGGNAIHTASQWELQPAALELEGVRPSARHEAEPSEAAAPAAVTLLNAAPLLAEDEVRGVTGYAGAFLAGKLADLPTTEFYDSRHLKAEGRPESFDVGLRVWRLGPAGAEAQYRKLLTQLPGAEVRDEIGDASLRARAGEVLGLAFLSRERGTVVSLTCGVNQCTDPAQLLRLAKLIEGHLGELAPAAPPAGAANPAVKP
jgi:hypothetical protein